MAGCWRLTNWRCSVQSRLFWGIDSWLRATLCIYRVTEQNGIEQILSFDSGLDTGPRIPRVS